jgi:hypothetical protein
MGSRLLSRKETRDPGRKAWAAPARWSGSATTAVNVGEQVAYVVTGLFQEFEDASHPGLAPAEAQP